MSELIVYHGGTEVVEKPVCHHGRPNLDFGQGFYVITDKYLMFDGAEAI